MMWISLIILFGVLPFVMINSKGPIRQNSAVILLFAVFLLGLSLPALFDLSAYLRTDIVTTLNESPTSPAHAFDYGVFLAPVGFVLFWYGIKLEIRQSKGAETQ